MPVELEVSTTDLVFHYNVKSLLISYAAAVLVTVLIVLVGLRDIHSDGVSHTNTFSALVRTTRNKDLDDWARGHCLGADPVDKEIAKRKPQYGILADDTARRQEKTDAVRHAAFGLQGIVTRLKATNACRVSCRHHLLSTERQTSRHDHPFQRV